MSRETEKILQMLADGKVSVQEAQSLLDALSAAPVGDGPRQAETSGSKVPGQKFLRVIVEPTSEGGKGERVNIRIPMKLLKAGMKFSSLMPAKAREKVDGALASKGIDLNLDSIKDNVEELMEGLSGLTVNVDEGEQKVKIFCE